MTKAPINPDSNNPDPKDGFDLLEYPCEFNFKAMCRADENVPSLGYLKKIIEPLVKADDLLSMKTNASRTGKFESVTALIRLQNREQLEVIYKAIASADRVVMTL